MAVVCGLVKSVNQKQRLQGDIWELESAECRGIVSQFYTADPLQESGCTREYRTPSILRRDTGERLWLIKTTLDMMHERWSVFRQGKKVIGRLDHDRFWFCCGNYPRVNLQGRFRTCIGTVRETDLDSVVVTTLARMKLRWTSRKLSMIKSCEPCSDRKKPCRSASFELAQSKSYRFQFCCSNHLANTSWINFWQHEWTVNVCSESEREKTYRQVSNLRSPRETDFDSVVSLWPRCFASWDESPKSCPWVNDNVS